MGLWLSMKQRRFQNALEAIVHSHNADPRSWPAVKPGARNYKPAALVTPHFNGCKYYHIYFTSPVTHSTGFIAVTPEFTPDGEERFRYVHRMQEHVFRKPEVYRALDRALHDVRY